MVEFKEDLCYCSPAHGGWGIIRLAAKIPDSYLLFVCPAACFRHGSLGAIQHGYKDQISYVYIQHEDIISGYDRVIEDSIEELLTRSKKTIRLLYIYVSCLDDFIGTDLEAVLEKARKKHTDIYFQAGHMNPIAADTRIPPMISTFDAMLKPLSYPSSRDKSISVFGNFYPYPKDSDLVYVLESHGHKVRQIGDCNTFEDYLDMSRSKYAVYVKPFVKYAIDNLSKRIGIIPIYMPSSFDIDVIDKQYMQLQQILGEDLSRELEIYRESAVAAVKRAKEAVGGIPIVVSDSATPFPFQLALALHKYGFNVTDVYAEQIIAPDEPALKAVTKEIPDINIVQSDLPKMYRRTTEEKYCIAIGEEGAYLVQSSFIANVTSEDPLYGYHGVRLLMEMIEESIKEKADIRKLIEEYGGVI